MSLGTYLPAQGHLLIESLPGMGKTTLAYTLAKALNLIYQRIPFMSDLLPVGIYINVIKRSLLN